MLHKVIAESTGLSIILIAWKIHLTEITQRFFSQVKILMVLRIVLFVIQKMAGNSIGLS